MMDYGVHITAGAMPWQIFQQSAEGTARISLKGTWRRIHQSFELPIRFEEVASGAVTVKARVALEATGESVCDWRLCEADESGGWSAVFDRVPAGGPYRIETYMEYEGWDGLSSTRGDMVHHIGVGDVFLIAGQSNAAGRSKCPVEDSPELGVHMLRPSGCWDIASHPLCDTTGAIFTGNFENHNPGHSPWLHFAKRLRRELGYPIGLVNAAYGGSPLRWWNPEENGSLLDNALALLSHSEVCPRAMLWYQGEAEGYEGTADSYGERFAAFLGSLRERLGSPELPVITVQLNRCMEPCDEQRDRQWGIVREAQRALPERMPNLYVVPSGDVSLYDSIHNSSEGDLVIGERCAKAALCELYGKDVNYKACQVKRAVRTAPDTLRLEFENVKNWLNTYELPPEQFPFDGEDEEGLVHPAACQLGRDTLTLTFPRPIGENAVVHGAWRMRGAVCLPWDCMRMPMLAFYGLPVEEGE